MLMICNAIYEVTKITPLIACLTKPHYATSRQNASPRFCVHLFVHDSTLNIPLLEFKPGQ